MFLNGLNKFSDGDRSSGASSPANSEGYRTPPRRIPSWSESSGSPRSYSPFNKDISYAGARFDEPPSPRVLPMPPVSWIPASPAPPSQRREVMELGLKKLLGIEK
ncbi:proline-rich nuclear receptor coactivator 2-like isoform X2 [Artemia franciscana]|uniref:proline-rich nuclear receptor coactivator 2-like isoform X2 n=1 Tax=Artemia franciscana TaxID=6661 RepID=UPI0032DA1514